MTTNHNPHDPLRSSTAQSRGEAQRSWSIHEASPLLAPKPQFALSEQGGVTPVPAGGDNDADDSHPEKKPLQQARATKESSSSSKGNFVYYIVYAIVNVIIAVPGLYGYASVIFNHPVFQPHMNALAKLVLFSSMLHQIGFLLFSSLDFAIGTVQDAGLIFLSSMANTIADQMLQDGATEEAIVSTTLALLSSGTALLGLILVAMGHFKLANAVSYLPMPVVGGYLAFIGYFCCQAGVALCISQPLVTLADWAYLAEPYNLLLATPGLLAALLLTWLSRNSENPGSLPLAMVSIPAVFYAIIYATGVGLEGARQGQWVGEVAPSVSVTELVQLVDLSLVRWDLVGRILWTWVGMIFVVSFASCLDVAAISMDMGEALDTNRELATVGICNFMSGLGLGFTGSYIFSQTIFTYRTGVHSRWIGVLVCIVYIVVVVSPMNLLQIAPLFFLGSTLIFIGYDLLYEWLVEIRESVLMSEYATIWGTFIAIQLVGVDAGIVIGILFAILENVVVTAQTTIVHRVRKRSRAVWNREGFKILEDYGYHPTYPKIISLELAGPVFFGSSLHVLNKLIEDTGLQQSESLGSQAESPLKSPHTSSYLLTKDRKHSFFKNPRAPTGLSRPPQFVVLDLAQVSSIDASAARACFLQFSKMCSKRGIVVVASGVTPRGDFMLRSHGASYPLDEEENVKEKIYTESDVARRPASAMIDRIILFMTVHEALEFCEATLIHQFHGKSNSSSPYSQFAGPKEHTLSSTFAHLLESDPAEREILRQFDNQRYYTELGFSAGEKVFTKEKRAEAIYVVLTGSLASGTGRSDTIYRHRQQVVSGAGLVRKSSSKSNLLDSAGESPVVGTFWPAGAVLGYTNFLLDRPNTFSAFATQDDTRLAKISRSAMNLIQQEDPALDALLHRALLRASVLDLANCTCDDV